MGYQSPIEVVLGDWKTQFERNVLKAVQDYYIYVNRDELIQALNYDRGQYQKGEWDMFELITSVYYGKQYYFPEQDGTVYSRASHKTMSREKAIQEFLDTIGEG